MKKIIFVCEALWVGGLEISLINILNNIDYTQYDVTCLILQDYQELVKRIPSHCKLKISSRVHNVSFKKPYSFLWLFGLIQKPSHAGKLRLIIWRVLEFLFKAIENNLYADYVRKNLKNEKYDSAFIYDNRSAEIGIKAISAHNYYMFYHHGIMSHAYHDCIGYRKSRKIIAVSRLTANRLKEYMPKYAPKICTINNLVDVDQILFRAEEYPVTEFNTEKLVIVSCGRLSSEKGIDLAVKACRILIDLGYTELRWYILGKGREEAALKELIHRLNVEEYMYLLGEKDNPFPYVKHADLFVQTSHFESFGLSLAEAMVLGVPVISTNTDGAVELTENGTKGLLCEINPKAIAETIQRVIDDPNMYAELKNAVKSKNFHHLNQINMSLLEDLLNS